MKDGQSTLSNGKADTGSAHKQESNTPNYFSKVSKVLGSGHYLVNQLDGLQTGSEDIARNYGN